jgi:hypothetical protein
MNHRKLKVYGGNIFVKGAQRRAIVAAFSQAEVARIIGCSLYEIRGWWSQTGNDHELEIALASPRTIFFTDINKHEAPYERLEK